jgi:hypothetical protein
VKRLIKGDQNTALRYFDVGIFAYCALIFVSFFIVGSTTLFAFIGTSICAVTELAICLSFTYLGFILKRRLKLSGEWKKLSRKEKFDLHEWKRSNW